MRSAVRSFRQHAHRREQQGKLKKGVAMYLGDILFDLLKELLLLLFAPINTRQLLSCSPLLLPMCWPYRGGWVRHEQLDVLLQLLQKIL
eukprot:1183344-Prorocentrum_minimum.AAC.5